MNPLLTILAGACLLLALSQQLIGTGAQEEVTPADPTVAGESTTTKDAGDSSQEDKPKGGKGHGCFVRCFATVALNFEFKIRGLFFC